MAGVHAQAMANTSPRPTIGTSTGLVTYVDSAGNTYPALVTIDFAATSASGNQGAIDVAYIDPNAADQEQPEDFLAPVRGRKRVYAANVPDQGNAGATTTPTGSVSSGSTSITVTSATGIPAAGFVTGAGIAQGTTANPAYNSLNPDIPATIPCGTAYTISGTTVTLATATTAGLTSSTNLFFSAQPSNYWRYPTTYTI